MVTSPHSLPKDQADLLSWLSEQEYSQYGECHGLALSSLIDQKLVTVHMDGSHQESFIAKGHNIMYYAVSLTEKGKQLAQTIKEQDIEKYAQKVLGQYGPQRALNWADINRQEAAGAVRKAFWDKIREELVRQTQRASNQRVHIAVCQTCGGGGTIPVPPGLNDDMGWGQPCPDCNPEGEGQEK